jgi:mannitol 2-dehydrogenase
MTTTPVTLNLYSLDDLPEVVKRPAYQPELVGLGIVHIGVGGFHRAHQAYYTDALMNQGKALDWGICGAGVRREDRKARDDLAGQDFFYTLRELGDTAEPEVRVIGSLRDMLLAEDDPEALIARMAEPNIRILSLTITEGGYCIDDSTGEFMAHLPQIQHDLANPTHPTTVFGFICAALQRRRAAGIRPFTVMSCDNLPHNGQVARKAVIAFATLAADSYGAGLAEWIAQQVAFPNAMVDRITPMTTATHRQQLRERYGVDDAWPAVCEPFVQWVLEDNFCDGRPAWEDVGVQFTDDVTPYENMKLKLLNGSHLALTYLGFLKGYRFVHETMNDPVLQQYIRDYMELVTPQLAPVPGIDLTEYKNTLIARFSNQAIADQLERVCSDGSSKFPKYSVPTIDELIRSGGDVRRAALVVAAWALYLRGRDEKGNLYSIPDPRAAFCQSLVAEDEGLAQRLLGTEDIFGTIIPASPAFIEAFEHQLRQLRAHGVDGAVKALNADRGGLCS